MTVNNLITRSHSQCHNIDRLVFIVHHTMLYLTIPVLLNNICLSNCLAFYILPLTFLLLPSVDITPRFVYLLPLAWDLWISKFAAVKLRLWGLWYCCWVIAQALQLGNCGTKMWSIMIHACMIHCKHSIKWKPSAISICHYFHDGCPAKGKASHQSLCSVLWNWS